MPLIGTHYDRVNYTPDHNYCGPVKILHHTFPVFFMKIKIQCCTGVDFSVDLRKLTVCIGDPSYG